MQYEIADVPADLDFAQFSRLLIDADPAAMVDRAAGSGRLRMSTVLDIRSIATLLGHAGAAKVTASIEQLPSTCCGGCSG